MSKYTYWNKSENELLSGSNASSVFYRREEHFLSNERYRFSSQKKWDLFLEGEGIDESGITPGQIKGEIHKTLEELWKLRQKPIIFYASSFQTSNTNSTINHEDTDEIADIILNDIPEECKEIDFIIHTEGGNFDATKSIVDILRPRFDQISFLVPSASYSMGTMMCFAGDEIIMHPYAKLGPIDPIVYGFSTKDVMESYRSALKSPKAHAQWLEKHPPNIANICQRTEKKFQVYARDWLSNYMLASKKGKEKQQCFFARLLTRFLSKDAEKSDIDEVLDALSRYDHTQDHSLPLSYKDVKNLPLVIKLPDGPIDELMREWRFLANKLFKKTGWRKMYGSREHIYGKEPISDKTES